MSTRRPSVQREYQQQVLLRWMTTITYRMITVGVILFVVGLAYLLYALFMLGDQGSYTAADVGRIQSNLTLFGRLALLGAGMVVIGLAWNFLEEETVGYVLVLLALFFYWGLPFCWGKSARCLSLTPCAVSPWNGFATSCGCCFRPASSSRCLWGLPRAFGVYATAPRWTRP
jgi:hypothetical protein